MSAGWAKQSCALTSQGQNHLEHQPERRKQSAYTGRRNCRHASDDEQQVGVQVQPGGPKRIDELKLVKYGNRFRPVVRTGRASGKEQVRRDRALRTPGTCRVAPAAWPGKGAHPSHAEKDYRVRALQFYGRVFSDPERQAIPSSSRSVVCAGRHLTAISALPAANCASIPLG